MIDPGAGARIGIRVVDGDGQFYRLSTGETWIPRGTNLMRFDRGGAEAPFAISDPDPAWTEEQLDAIAARATTWSASSSRCACPTGTASPLRASA